MKNLLYIVLFLSGISFLNSCKTDDYNAPSATLTGTLFGPDNQGLQLEQGSGSTRIKMEELSWSDSPVPLYLNLKQDGSYINTKLFDGTYLATPVDGPYYPVISGDTIVINGAATHDFHVVPYLEVEFVEEPKVTPEGKVTAIFKFKRNPSPNGEAMPNLLDYQLFISTTEYVGNNNFDATIVSSAVNVANSMEGNELVISSSKPMKYATTYYVRVGVRVNDSFKKYNYTPIKLVKVTHL